MKKLIKFKTRPAYFCMGDTLPSSVGRGEYFHPVARIDNPDSGGCMISASMLGFKGHTALSFGRTPYEAGEVVEKWTQVPESEWLIAAERLKADIDGKGVQDEQ